MHGWSRLVQCIIINAKSGNQFLLSAYDEIFVKSRWVKETLPLTKALLTASINLSSSMETRFFACSGVVDHTNELKFSANLTQIKRKKSSKLNCKQIY